MRRLVMAVVVTGIAAAVVWQRRVGVGPAERIYRTIGG